MKITNFDSDQAIINELAKRIKSYRLSLLMTQEQLEEQTGISKRTIQLIESGKHNYSIDKLIKILKALSLATNFNTLIPENIAPLRFDTKIQERQRARKTHKAKIKWSEDK